MAMEEQISDLPGLFEEVRGFEIRGTQEGFKR